MPYNFVPDSFHTAVTAEALRAKIDRKSAILHQRGHFDPKFQEQRVAPTNNFCTVTTLPLTVFTQRNFVADFLQAKFIGKRVVDFLLALIELFPLGVTAEELRAIIGWKSAISLQRGSVDPKFQVEGVALHQPFFFSEN